MRICLTGLLSIQIISFLYFWRDGVCIKIYIGHLLFFIFAFSVISFKHYDIAVVWVVIYCLKFLYLRALNFLAHFLGVCRRLHSARKSRSHHPRNTFVLNRPEWWRKWGNAFSFLLWCAALLAVLGCLPRHVVDF